MTNLLPDLREAREAFERLGYKNLRWDKATSRYDDAAHQEAYEMFCAGAKWQTAAIAEAEKGQGAGRAVAWIDDLHLKELQAGNSVETLLFCEQEPSYSPLYAAQPPAEPSAEPPQPTKKRLLPESAKEGPTQYEIMRGHHRAEPKGDVPLLTAEMAISMLGQMGNPQKPSPGIRILTIDENSPASRAIEAIASGTAVVVAAAPEKPT
jgi:hypothetical protein